MRKPLFDVQQESFSVRQVAVMHHLSERTVLRMIKRGELHAVKFGRQLRIPVAELRRLLSPGDAHGHKAT